MRAGGLSLIIALTLLAPATDAAGEVVDHHFMRIVELDAGQPGDPAADFVDLQMYEPGQQVVGGKKLRVYAANGSAQDCTFPSDAASGADNDHILIAAASSIHGVAPDFLLPGPLLESAGGAVCFATTIDCVSWGTFAGTTTSPSGTPIAESFGDDDTSMHRDTGLDMTLQGSDDTNDSAADFSPAAPTPEANPGAGAPEAMTCAPVTIPPGGGDGGDVSYSLQGLKARIRLGRAIVSGTVVPDATGRVKVVFLANGSPLRKVAASKPKLNDHSRFRTRFRVPSDATRCKVLVRYSGSKLGGKRFRC